MTRTVCVSPNGPSRGDLFKNLPAYKKERQRFRRAALCASVAAASTLSAARNRLYDQPRCEAERAQRPHRVGSVHGCYRGPAVSIAGQRTTATVLLRAAISEAGAESRVLLSN